MFKKYLSICWFGGDPAELPVSKSFLWKILTFYLIAGLFIQSNITDPVEAFIQVFIELFITLLFIGALLIKRKNFTQFERITTAILFSESFVYVLALPMAIWYIVVKETEYAMYPAIAGSVLIIWSCAIISYLLKGILNYALSLSIVLSIAYFMITYLGSLGLISM